MKKIFKYLMIFTACLTFNGIVNAKEYELKEFESIKVNGEHEDRVFIPVNDFYEFINNGTSEVYEGPKEVLKISDGQYSGKDYVMCVIPNNIEDPSEGPYNCKITSIYYPSGSEVVLDKTKNDVTINYSLYLAKDASLNIEEGKNLTTSEYFTAYAGSKVNVSGTFTANALSYVYGNLTGKIDGKAHDVPEQALISVASNSNGSLTVTVTNALDYQTYKIYRATSKTGKYTLVATLSSAKPTYTYTGGKVGSTYYFKAKALKSNGSSTNYTTVKSARVKYTEKPTINVASTGKTSIKISWAKVPGATGYQVYRSTSKTGKYTLVKTTTSTSFINSSLTTGRYYYYKVRPYRTISKKKYYGVYSTVKSDMPKVNKPTFKVSSYDYNVNKVSITKVSGANGYQIYRSTSKTGTYKLIATTTKTTYLDKKLTTGKEYFYKVRAYATVSKTKKYGNFGEIMSSTPKLKTPTFTINNMTSRDKLVLNITKVNGASGYDIYKFNGTEYELVNTISSTQYIDTNLTLGEEYAYKVVAYRGTTDRQVSAESKEVKSIVKPAKLKAEYELIEYNAQAMGAILPELKEDDEVIVSVYRKTGSSDYVLLSSAKINEATEIPSVTTPEELKPYYDKILVGTNTENNKIFEYISSNLKYGETYKYKLTVTINGVESEYSNVVGGKVIIGKAQFVALNAYYDTALMGSKDVLSADGYEIYKATSKNGKYSRIYSGAKNSFSYKAGFNKTYYYKVRAYKVINGVKKYGAFSNVKKFKTGIIGVDKYPVSLHGSHSDVKIKSVTFTKKRVSGNYVYYTMKVNISSAYATKNVKAELTTKFYNGLGNVDYTWYLTTATLKKGTKRNFSQTFDIKLPKTSVYFEFI